MTHSFHAPLWQYPGKGAWFFVTLPVDLSKEIRKHFKGDEEGWGRLKVKACIGKSMWDTAIWFDTKHESYLLPVKKEIRIKEDLVEGTMVLVNLLL